MKTATKAGRILIPAHGPEDWRQFLAEPEKQWKDGFSAKSMAQSWHQQDGLPEEIQQALESVFTGVELLLAVPEWQVSLPGGSRPSQNDVWALCRTDTGLLSLAVEGKVDEPFGPTVGEWMKGASAGKQERMAFLCKYLGLDDPPPDAIRYQLLHRTVSAIIEAERFHAAHAVMVVQSFSQEDRWFEDYADFAELLRAAPIKNQLTAVPAAGSTMLHIGWACRGT